MSLFILFNIKNMILSFSIIYKFIFSKFGKNFKFINIYYKKLFF